jgi:MFS family permease
MGWLDRLETWKGYFGDPQGGLLGLFNAIQVSSFLSAPSTRCWLQNIGGIAGLPFAPYISDRFGRRVTIFGACIIMLIATALQTASQSIGMFIGE